MVSFVLKGLGLDYSMFVTTIINALTLLEFLDLWSRLLQFENQTRVEPITQAMSAVMPPQAVQSGFNPAQAQQALPPQT